MKVDLHLHSTFSDGIHDPDSLIALAYENGVKFLSITDHDSLDGLEGASKKAKALGIQFVNGVELNTQYGHQEIHILGYGFNHQDGLFNERLLYQRKDRKIRFEKMIDRLHELGIPLDPKTIDEVKGVDSLGRPHLALALIQEKKVKTVEEAFRKYLGYGKSAWVPRNYWTPQFAISAIHQAGGLAVLAHPERGGKKVLHELTHHGLDGIEVYYPSHSSVLIQTLRKTALMNHLFVTVGSDYHGINPGERGPGSVAAPEEVIQEILRILGKRADGQKNSIG